MTEENKSKLNAAIVQVTPFQQNCALLWDDETKRGAVIDPGGDIDRIKDAIAEVGMTPEKIVLTHGHIDHAGGATELQSVLGVDIVGPHRADQFLLEGLEAQGREYGFPARNVTPTSWLEEGETVDIGGFGRIRQQRAQVHRDGRCTVQRLDRTHGLSVWQP